MRNYPALGLLLLCRSCIALQFAEGLHLALCSRSFSLLPVKTREAEVCLCCQRALIFNAEQFCPRILSRSCVSAERRRFAEGVEGFRHVGFQAVCPFQFCTRLAHFAILK